jgi:hypothetical protein
LAWIAAIIHQRVDVMGSLLRIDILLITLDYIIYRALPVLKLPQLIELLIVQANWLRHLDSTD